MDETPHMIKSASRRNMLRLLSGAAAISLPGCTSGSSGQNANGASSQSGASSANAVPVDDTFDEDTVLDAAQQTFGDGAEGIANVIERVFADNGRPYAYISGEEAGGGFIGALRYGGGTLHHKIEGERAIHWTGPSIGLEAGGNASKSFMLVYSLFNTDDIFARFPAVEGQGYFVGGLGVNYLQRSSVKVVNIRLGVGLRYSANLGYVKFTKNPTVNPF